MTKRILAIALLTTVLVACGKKDDTSAPSAASTSAEPKVLNIYNWPDYITEDMLARFTQETGIRVNYDTFETNEAMHAKLVAGNSGYDLVIPTAGFARKQIEGGLFQPIDKSRIPNLKNLDPAFMSKIAAVDPGNQHLVPWAWGFTTVGINQQRVEKALGDLPMPENAWDLVFNPQYTNRLRSCGIALLDSPSEILPVALHYLGRPPFSDHPDDFKAVSALLAKVRPDIRLFSSTMIDDIAAGRACVFIGWSGDINIAADRMIEMGRKDQVMPLLPKTGGLIFIDTMAIPRDAKHVQNAHLFIDFYLRAENGAAMATEMNYPTGNLAALPLIDDAVKGNKTIFLQPDDMNRLIASGAFSNESASLVNDTYNAFKRGK